MEQRLSGDHVGRAGAGPETGLSQSDRNYCGRTAAMSAGVAKLIRR